MDKKKKQELEKQGYRFVGKHSAIKVCEYCRESLRNKDHCYKQEFYGIKSHRCCQMTPTLDFCNLRCKWCWRDIAHTKHKWIGTVDKPKDIVDGCIAQQRKYLQGFKGRKGTGKKKFKEAEEPNQFAISLAGEPTFYPKLPELIEEIKSRNHTAFLVTNGTIPSMLNKILKKPSSHPTNLYITLEATDKKSFKQCCRPLIPVDTALNNIIKSLKIMSKFKSRTTIRLTLTKGLNLKDPEKYAELIKIANPDGIEVKAYMWVGYSRKRLPLSSMPTHDEIKAFAMRLKSYLPDYKLTKQKIRSRVALLEKR